MVRVMRVAFIGKGGSGKSTIAGTFARLLARTGRPVLAIDSDPMPGLTFSLGIQTADAGIPDEVLEDFTDEEGRTQTRLRAGLSSAEAVDKYAREGPDGVRFLQLQKSWGQPMPRLAQAFRHVVDELPVRDWSIVGDLPGGTRQPFFGWGGYADTVLVVVEPTPASMLTARRLARLATSEGSVRVVAVANKVREPGDTELIAARTGLTVLGAVNVDPAQESADRLGRALLDHDGAAMAVAGVASLVQTLLTDERTTEEPT